jgi:hypothetical protein
MCGAAANGNANGSANGAVGSGDGAYVVDTLLQVAPGAASGAASAGWFSTMSVLLVSSLLEARRTCCREVTYVPGVASCMARA